VFVVSSFLSVGRQSFNFKKWQAVGQWNNTMYINHSVLEVNNSLINNI
jgi:hypothetical protein